MQAWQTALTILNWHENLRDKECPPRKIWFNDKKLAEHFDNLKKKWAGKGDGEAPEGTIDQARSGQEVTLRNSLLDEILSSHSNDDDYDTL